MVVIVYSLTMIRIRQDLRPIATWRRRRVIQPAGKVPVSAATPDQASTEDQPALEHLSAAKSLCDRCARQPSGGWVRHDHPEPVGIDSLQNRHSFHGV
jgi:hypothetical protein